MIYNLLILILGEETYRVISARSIALFFFSIVATNLNSQNIKIEGVVHDGRTKEVLPYANVFINQTTLGSVADSNGNYSISNLAPGFVELVCSYVGYQPYSEKIEIKGQTIYRKNIILTPLVVELKSVEIKADHDSEWDSQLEKFKRVFLGQNANAKGCKILNPWHLEFKEESTSTGMHFTATSTQPLEIENMALGYHITYYLQRLEFDQDMYVIGGRSRFKELMTTDSSLAKTWAANRAKAFLGSARHLLTSLKDGRAKEEGFLLYFKKTPPPYQIQGGFTNQIGKSVYHFPSTNIVSPDVLGLYRVSFNVPIVEVHYSHSRVTPPVYPDVSYPVSWLEVKGGSLMINSQGIVMNPGSLFIYGAMSITRIASLLPDDYSPGSDALALTQPSTTNLQRLQEKVYLHTDKAYYRPGETIWFKAYLNYRSALVKDTLSRVLYVELISKEKKIITTKIIKLNEGTAWGDLDLPNDISTGSYFIRAYTQWMLNFSSQEIFYQFVPIIRNDQIPMLNPKDSIELLHFPRVQIVTERKAYHPREKIDVRLLVVDEDHIPQEASLSVSVTDMNQVVPIFRNSILSGLLFRGEPKDLNQVRFGIESGISFSGVCKNKKGKSVAENLLMTKVDSNESLLIDTKSDGKFAINGLQFEDTATFSLKSVSVKKSLTSINIISRFIPPIDSLGEYQLNLTNHLYAEKPMTGEIQNSILLKAVVIEATRIDEKKQSAEYANFAVDGETLTKLNPNSLLFGLNSRFTFIRINTIYEAGSLVPTQRVNISSNFTPTFVSAPEPLLFINGLQVNLGGEPIYDILLRITPDQVERVEINKSASGSSYSPTYGNRGSISIYLKNGASLSQAKVNSGNFSQQIKLAGYQHAKTFKVPDYSSGSTSEFLDNRSTIYWNPQLYTNGTSGKLAFSFYSADLDARYKIEVEGVTSSGKPVRGVYYLEIKK